jgi:uncharacterized membrane protein YfcA
VSAAVLEPGLAALAVSAVASLLAGLVDAIVGGGGLVLLPALFATFPQAPPATLFGTNKSASVWGTSFAAAQYLKRVSLPWDQVLPAVACAGVGALAGAWMVTLVDGSALRKVLPLILGAVLVYTVLRKDLGTAHAPRHEARQARRIAALIGLLVGWYDGFFGPGTGSFFIFALVRLLGWDFLHASAGAKLMNVATNLTALALFAAKGHVVWVLGLTMAVANVAGSLIGARLALRHGAGFVRGVFIAVVSLLIVRTAWDAWLR